MLVTFRFFLKNVFYSAQLHARCTDTLVGKVVLKRIQNSPRKRAKVLHRMGPFSRILFIHKGGHVWSQNRKRNWILIDMSFILN